MGTLSIENTTPTSLNRSENMAKISIRLGLLKMTLAWKRLLRGVFSSVDPAVALIMGAPAFHAEALSSARASEDRGEAGDGMRLVIASNVVPFRRIREKSSATENRDTEVTRNSRSLEGA